VTSQSETWKSVAAELGIRIAAPFVYTSSAGKAEFAAMLPDFGGKSGIIADPDWDKIEPHKTSLKLDGYGLACVEISGNTGALIEVLKDWTWTGTQP
jgi:hypothetical protein